MKDFLIFLALVVAVEVLLVVEFLLIGVPGVVSECGGRWCRPSIGYHAVECAHSAPDQVEAVRPLELLHRTADFVGAVVCLASTADRRGDEGKRPYTRDNGAQLTKLVVVRPAPTAARYASRWRRLQQGIVLCQVPLEECITIDDAATVLVEQLHAAINDDWRKRSTA